MRGALALFGGERSVPEGSVTYWPAPDRWHERAVGRVLESGRFHRVNHPLIVELEERLTAFASREARVLGSGTSAIHVAIDHLTDPGDDVLVAAYNWPGAVGPTVALGRNTVYADVDIDTGCLGRSALPAMFEARATVVTHLFGCWPDLLSALPVDGSVSGVVHDCAQALGAVPHLADRLHDAIVISGNGSKHLGAGELGGLLSADRALIDHVDTVSLSSSARDGGRIFSPLSDGFNYRPSIFSASIAIERLARFAADAAARRRNAGILQRSLEKLDGIEVLPTEAGYSVPLMAVFRLTTAIDGVAPTHFRESIIELLLAEGVPAGIWLQKPVWEYVRGAPRADLKDFPNTAKLLEQEFHIAEIGTPNSEVQMRQIVSAFEKVWDALPGLHDWMRRGHEDQ